ncbi:MAG TPA: hypothetical protein VM287_07420, partial [Egibacteraceae bacterium]|nr:hypothetical protein [Egibacteraceae bacterium]
LLRADGLDTESIGGAPSRMVDLTCPPRRSGCGVSVIESAGSYVILTSDGAVHVVATGDVGPQRLEEWPFECSAEPEHRGIPLQLLVHTGEGAVVQLVAEVQRELDILAVGVDAAIDPVECAGRASPAQNVYERAGQRPPLTGERGGVR